jgi:hypothetical protein
VLLNYGGLIDFARVANTTYSDIEGRSYSAESEWELDRVIINVL